MSSINVKLDYVKGINTSVSQSAAKLSNIHSGLSSLRYHVDGEIRARRNIDARLNNAGSASAKLESQIHKLELFINKSMDKYRDVDDYLVKKAVDNTANVGNSIGSSNGSIPGVGNTNTGGFDFGMVKSAFKSLNRSYKVFSKFYTLQPGNGMNFWTFKKNGEVFIRIASGKIENQADFLKYRKMLEEYLGGTAKWKRDFVTDLANEGIPLYNNRTGKYYKNNSNKFRNTEFGKLDKYLDILKLSGSAAVWKAGKDAFKSSISFWEDFRGWGKATTIGKIGKGLGAVGTVLNIGGNFMEHFYNQQTGQWEPTLGGVKEFLIDTGVDMASGATAAATGAMLGSFILPPLGTVVGTVAGIAISVGINWPLPFLDPPKSVVDLTKDLANYAIDSLFEGVKNTGKLLSKIFW